MKGQFRQDDFLWAVVTVLEGLVGIAAVLGLAWVVVKYGESLWW